METLEKVQDVPDSSWNRDILLAAGPDEPSQPEVACPPLPSSSAGKDRAAKQQGGEESRHNRSCSGFPKKGAF